MDQLSSSYPSNWFNCCHGIRHGDMGRRSVLLVSIQLVQLLSWLQAQGRGSAFCPPRIHRIGSVAVMASGTGTWVGVLSSSYPSNWFSYCHGIRHRDVGRSSVLLVV
ncbi:hypothetical protein AVEN_93401-1 [Araneus ventricosus]|uniref:Uncharacterized protein n=1 Tax=Araneus ventricosus TaxID=182803 RepID=A0A4Y2AP61_ARAVE|nr:hypothetical protein AVEN_93401-1 [Araneus ventricosus]